MDEKREIARSVTEIFDKLSEHQRRYVMRLVEGHRGVVEDVGADVKEIEEHIGEYRGELMPKVVQYYSEVVPVKALSVLNDLLDEIKGWKVKDLDRDLQRTVTEILRVATISMRMKGKLGKEEGGYDEMVLKRVRKRRE